MRTVRCSDCLGGGGRVSAFGGVCRGCLPGKGVCLGEGVSVWGGGECRPRTQRQTPPQTKRQTPHPDPEVTLPPDPEAPSLNRITDRCKNIIFPQLVLRTVTTCNCGESPPSFLPIHCGDQFAACLNLLCGMKYAA